MLTAWEGLYKTKKLKRYKESISTRFGKFIDILNQMIKDKIIEDYTLGGATALMYYSIPLTTEDIDIFIALKNKSLLIDLSPIYKYLKDNYNILPEGEHLNFNGIKIQIIIPPKGLQEEAFNNYDIVNFEGKKLHIFKIEYLIAIMLELNKSKYKHRLSYLDEEDYDNKLLNKILKKYNLISRWEKIKNEI